MKRLLIIDDDADLVNLLTTAFKGVRYAVASAGDPVKGLEIARSFHPDIILLDYHLPGTTGAHLFETFRRNTATSRTPILFMSGEAKPEDLLNEIAESEGSRFLAKPVRIAELLKIVSEMLETPKAAG